MDLTKGIWQRTGSDELSVRKYAFFVGMFFVWTVLLVFIGTYISYGWRYSLIVSIVSFIGAIAGIQIFSNADQPGKSFVGVTILSFFLGLTIGPILAYYDVSTIANALMITFGVTFVMSLLGVLLPNVMKGAGGILMIGLVLLMFVYLGAAILSIFRVYVSLSIVDYFAAGLFSLYIWYDWSRSLKLPKTVDNAIDSSGALIVDVVNLFMTMLRIVARSR